MAQKTSASIDAVIEGRPRLTIHDKPGHSSNKKGPDTIHMAKLPDWAFHLTFKNMNFEFLVGDGGTRQAKLTRPASDTIRALAGKDGGQVVSFSFSRYETAALDSVRIKGTLSTRWLQSVLGE
jgi:hypothetical protein